MRIILASASPRRLELLRSLGFDVLVEPSNYPENDLQGLSPRENAIEHARAKSIEARRAHPDELVLAADTVVELDGEMYGKPRDASDAARMLHDLSGRTHVVHTAYALGAPHVFVEECESANVRFHRLDDREIAEYVATGEPLDKAGAYGIQGYGAALVERIDGDFYTVMGFPLARFIRTLRRLGLPLPITKVET